MSYPNAYCVKCGAHTDTQQKHTVMLQNNSRALKGVCPSCATDVYKILPKGKSYLTRVPLTMEERQHYPDAFCVKCREHTPTKNAHTIMFGNQSRALTGACQKCGCEVYRILSPKEAKAGQTGALSLAQVAPAAPAPAVALTRGEDQVARSGYTAYVAAAGMILGIIMAFFAYTYF